MPASPVMIPGFKYVAAWWAGAARLFHVVGAPTLLVVHCGWKRRALAEFMRDPVDKPRAPMTMECKDGKWRRMVMTHGAWCEEEDCLVQMLGLQFEGWGTGKAATWHHQVAQRTALHVELPGPPEQVRTAHQLEELRRFASGAKAERPTLEAWCRHSDLDPSREDPGKTLPDDWADGILTYDKGR